MRDCVTCKYGGHKGNVYVVCKYFNRVINTKEFNGCPSYQSKNMKLGLEKKLLDK